MSITSLSMKSFTIKTTIGFSIAIALALVMKFMPLAGSDSVSAAVVDAADAAAAAGAAAAAAAGAHSGGHGGSGGNGGHGGHGGGHGGHDRPDIIWPESAEVQARISELRHATARFHDIEVALKEGYEQFGDCFSDPVQGNMGYHYRNPELIEDPAVDPNHPELLLYEKQDNGTFKFVGVEYITFQAAWHKAGNRLKPRLFGEWFHLNTTLLDEPFYLLHVWQWKHNPSGRFVDWNPRVVCR
jgi:hypothetical protein